MSDAPGSHRHGAEGGSTAGDWESVTASECAPGTENPVDAGGAAGDGVVVELPPGGIGTVPGDGAASSLASSSVGHIEAFRVASSLGSSFVGGMDDLKVASDSSFVHLSKDDVSSATGSSFVHVPKGDGFNPSGWHGDENFARSWCDIAVIAQPALRARQFDIATRQQTSSSYYQVKVCKRCTFHNHLNAEMCQCCGFGSNIDSDEKMARNLQQQDDEDSLGLFGDVTPDHMGGTDPFVAASLKGSSAKPTDPMAKETAHCGLVSNIPSVEQVARSLLQQEAGDGFDLCIDSIMPHRMSRFFGQANAFLSELPEVGLRILDHHRLLDLALPFSKALAFGGSGCAKISLMYMASPADQGSFEKIRDNGFDTGLGPTIKFTDNIDAALALAKEPQPSKHNRGGWRRARAAAATGYLDPIPEHRGEHSNYCCWVAVTARFKDDGTVEQVVRAMKSGFATVWSLGRPELAFPLVRFHSALRNTDVVRLLKNKFSRILHNNFRDFESHREIAIGGEAASRRQLCCPLSGHCERCMAARGGGRQKQVRFNTYEDATPLALKSAE